MSLQVQITLGPKQKILQLCKLPVAQIDTLTNNISLGYNTPMSATSLLPDQLTLVIDMLNSMKSQKEFIHCQYLGSIHKAYLISFSEKY